MRKRNYRLLVLCVLVISVSVIFSTVIGAATPTSVAPSPVMYTLTITPVNNGNKATIDINPPGSAIKTATTLSYPPGTVVTLKANDYMVQPETIGYKFQSWSGAATGSARTITITMDANKSVTAQYGVIAIDWPTPSARRVTPTPTRRPVTPTPTRRNTPSPTRRPYVNITYYIEKVNDASEQGPQTGRFRLWTTQTGTISVDGYSRVYYTVSGSATNGVDYQTLEGYVYVKVGMIAPTLPAGSPRDYIDIKPLVDNLIEGTETVTITLKDVTVGVGKGSATLNIADSGSTITPTPTPTTVTYTLTVAPLGYSLCPIDVNPPGVSITAKTTFTYPAGTVVNLKAYDYYDTSQPYSAEYRFYAWTGDLTGRQNPITITMNGNKSVGVQYMIIDHFPPTPTPRR